MDEIVNRKVVEKRKNVHIFTDGGSRGNPGQAAIGVYIEDEEHKKIFSLGEKIGIATNNVAEYTAVIEAFRWLISQKEEVGPDAHITFFMDSLLICSQIKGLFRVKDYKLQELLYAVRECARKLSNKITYAHIPREKNKQADLLVNLALDNKL